MKRIIKISIAICRKSHRIAENSLLIFSTDLVLLQHDIINTWMEYIGVTPNRCYVGVYVYWKHTQKYFLYILQTGKSYIWRERPSQKNKTKKMYKFAWSMRKQNSNAGKTFFITDNKFENLTFENIHHTLLRLCWKLFIVLVYYAKK